MELRQFALMLLLAVTARPTQVQFNFEFVICILRIQVRRQSFLSPFLSSPQMKSILVNKDFIRRLRGQKEEFKRNFRLGLHSLNNKKNLRKTSYYSFDGTFQPTGKDLEVLSEEEHIFTSRNLHHPHRIHVWERIFVHNI